MKPTSLIRTILFAIVSLALLAGIVTRQAAAQTRIDLEVKRAVVRIVPERCFGATTCLPQNDQPGSGVIIHPTGLILTAWHVLSADKDFQQENYWDDFVIEMIDEDDGVPPVPRYRAKIVATRPEMDLAILRIDRNFEGRPVTDEALAALPWLPVYDLSITHKYEWVNNGPDGGDVL
jgi:S1-C subfamily serine protease